MNNLLSYCGLVDARIRASNKDLPVRWPCSWLQINFWYYCLIHQANGNYPLLVYVYGGPGSQSVDQKWKIGYEDYLTSNYGIVYAIIDGRGTGFQSNDYKFEVFHKLGSVEMEDQIDGAKQLLEKFSFLDSEKTGIWGWSYGGYTSAMTLIKVLYTTILYI